MSFEIEEVDPLVGDSWDEEALGHPDATSFHESSWARVLSDTYRHKPCYLRFSRGDELVALVPLMEVKSWARGARGVSLPFSDSCCPLFFNPDTAPEVLRSVESYALKKKWRYVELRGMAHKEVDGASAEPSTFLAHELPLGGDEKAQFSLLKSAAQRSVRRAGKSGLTVRVSQSWSSLQKFCSLHERTRKRHGVPPQSMAFFRNIHRSILDSGRGFISLVEKRGRPVAGAVFFCSRHRATYKFGASDDRFLSDRPNHLAIWEGIRTLIARGIPLLEFGRTCRYQEGLRRFKRSWGARELDLSYFRSDLHSGRWTVRQESPASPLISGFRFMPLPINRLAGRILYPHLD